MIHKTTLAYKDIFARQYKISPFGFGWDYIVKACPHFKPYKMNIIVVLTINLIQSKYINKILLSQVNKKKEADFTRYMPFVDFQTFAKTYL